MSIKTRLLNLFKYDTEADKKKTFKIDEALNDNWDKIEENSLATRYDENVLYNKSNNDWVWDIVDDEKLIFESLVDENMGNPLTDKTKWKVVSLRGSGLGGLSMFDLVMKDHVLSFEEARGLALQGTYVYKTGITGERWGYPDFVQKCIEEKTAGTPTQVTLGDSEITMYKNANGHLFYDISDKTIIDDWFNTWGIAWFYGVDTENERVFLPRNIRYFKNGTPDNVGTMQKASIPNVKGSTGPLIGYSSGETTDEGCMSCEVQQIGVAQAGSNGGSGQRIVINASKNSSVYSDNATTIDVDATNQLLYIVVGNTTEITNITTTIPSDEIISQVNQNTTDIVTVKTGLNEKLDASDVAAYIVKTYQNGASGYRIYSDGRCQQWGRQSGTTVTLLKTYRNVQYNIQLTVYNTDETAYTPTAQVVTRQNNSIKVATKINGAGNYSANMQYYWFTDGTLADDEDIE